MSINKNPKVDIKRRYLRDCETGTKLSLVIIIMAFLYLPNIEKSILIFEQAQELVDVEDIINMSAIAVVEATNNI